MHLVGPTAAISPLRRTISEYQLTTYGWAFNAAVMVLAAGSLVLIAGLLRHRLAGPGGVLMLLGWVAGLVTLAVFPKHNWAIGPSATGQVHRIASLVAFICLPLGVMLIAGRWRRNGLPKVLSRWAFWLGALSLAWFLPIIVAILLYPQTGVSWWRAIPLGLVERGLAASEVAALVVLGIAMLRRPARSSSRPGRRGRRAGCRLPVGGLIAVSIVPSGLAVTGATGKIGGQVSRLLADDGIPHRLLVRDPDRAPDVLGTTVHRAEYADTVETRAALDGVETLFMVSASEHPDRRAQHRAFVDAAAAMGVAHVVYLSFAGAAPDATFLLARDHFDTEQHLRAAGLTTTVLRDNLYADFLPGMAGPDGVIRGPAGDGRLAAVAQADVARCAAAVLADPAAHRDATYELSGPHAMTMAEVAVALSTAGGQPVRFESETIEEAWASRRPSGAPDWMIEAWISTYTAVAAGELDRVTDDVRRLSGREPLSLADLLAGS